MKSNSWLNPATNLYRGIGRRTKRAYQRLFEQPNYLFGRGTRTTIFPNGEREIWIKNTDGTAAFVITASDGPAGMSISVRVPVGCLAADVHSMTRKDYLTHITEDVREVTIISYYPDAYSQAFKQWYQSDARSENGDKVLAHPSDLGLTPREMKPENVDRQEQQS